MTDRVAWIDCTAGVAGDMLLGALHDLDVLADLPLLVTAIDATVTFDDVRRSGLRATSARVSTAAKQPRRHLSDVVEILRQSPVEVSDRPAIDKAVAVFQRLASAEAAVHGVSVDEVHFHEVGAVDAIVDVLGSCLGFHRLGLDAIVVSPIALGGGIANSMHGEIPVPGPAVLGLLAGSRLSARGGGSFETATPTGVAVLAEWGSQSGDLPGMRIDAVGVGAGSRDLPGGPPNAVRIVVGASAPAAPEPGGWHVVEANIDDLDPRLLPGVIKVLLDAGAADAWLTPILMKKGRPAHTLHAIVAESVSSRVVDAIFASTTTIGIRSHRIAKTALDRTFAEVVVDGQVIRVKLATLDGRVITATPEWSDIESAAASTGSPTRLVHTLASAQAAQFLGPDRLGD